MEVGNKTIIEGIPRSKIKLRKRNITQSEINKMNEASLEILKEVISEAQTSLCLDSDIIDVGRGQISFPMSSEAEKAATNYIRNSKGHYSDKKLLHQCQQAMADLMNEDYKLGESNKFKKENAVFVNGGMNGFDLVLSVFDIKRILMITPIYPNYIPNLESHDPNHISYILIDSSGKKGGYKPDIQNIKDAFEYAKDKGGIDGIVLQYPHNPTGSVLNDQDAKDLSTCFCEMQDKYNKEFLVILDESYKGIGDSSSVLTFIDPKKFPLGNIAIIYSASKRDSMVTLGLGCIISKNSNAIQDLRSLKQATTLYNNNPALSAWFAHISSPDYEKRQKEMAEFYRENRRYITNALNEMSGEFSWDKDPVIRNSEEKGGMFVFADFSKIIGLQIPEEFLQKIQKLQFSEERFSLEKDEDNLNKKNSFIKAMKDLFDSKTTFESDVDIVYYLLFVAKTKTIAGSGFMEKADEGKLRICISGEYQKKPEESILSELVDRMKNSIQGVLDYQKKDLEESKVSDVRDINVEAMQGVVKLKSQKIKAASP